VGVNVNVSSLSPSPSPRQATKHSGLDTSLYIYLHYTDTKGGFARVYEVIDPEGRRRAVKVVHKASIRTKKNKTKVCILAK